MLKRYVVNGVLKSKKKLLKKDIGFEKEIELDNEFPVIPEGIMELGDDCFSGCGKMKRVELPKSLKIIRSKCFSGCQNLEFVTLPDGLEEIKESAFEWCNISELFIPDSVVMIGDYAFFGSLTAVHIGKGIKIITSRMFFGTDLSAIEIPETIEIIEKEAFSSVHSLSKVVISDGVKVIESAAFKSCPLKEVIMGKGVRKIGMKAFSDCWDLTELNIGEGVEYIGDYAFESCEKLKSVHLSPSVKKLCAGVFRKCESLKELTIYDSIEETEDHLERIFEGCISLIRINVRGKWNEVMTKLFHGMKLDCIEIDDPSSVPEEFQYVFQGKDISAYQEFVLSKPREEWLYNKNGRTYLKFGWISHAFFKGLKKDILGVVYALEAAHMIVLEEDGIKEKICETDKAVYEVHFTGYDQLNMPLDKYEDIISRFPNVKAYAFWENEYEDRMTGSDTGYPYFTEYTSMDHVFPENPEYINPNQFDFTREGIKGMDWNAVDYVFEWEGHKYQMIEQCIDRYISDGAIEI